MISHISYLKNWPKCETTVVGGKGLPNIFHEMIHTWVTYEVVKMLYLFGLKPTINEKLKEWSPDIYNLVKYVTDIKDHDKENAERAREVLFKKTTHTAIFEKCTLGAKMILTKDRNLIGLIPIVMLAWLLQLQEYFQDNNNDWNTHGRYYGSEEQKRIYPLKNVVMKNSKGEKHEITEYRQVKLRVKQNENKPTVCTLLEEWAMYILNPSIPTILDEAKKNDRETKKRWERYTKKIGAEQIKTYMITNTDLTKGGQRDKGTDNNKATSEDKELSEMSNGELFDHIAVGLKDGLELIKKKTGKKPTEAEQSVYSAMMSAKKVHGLLEINEEEKKTCNALTINSNTENKIQVLNNTIKLVFAKQPPIYKT
jgi:hypothetical protein